MAKVSLSNVKKSFGKVEVVHGVDCDIADGEFIVVLGPSGCGKSTVLRMIAGLEQITGGEIAIAGEVVNRLEPAERDIAMVFQTYALYPHMTVFNNMAYGLKIRGRPKTEIEESVRKAAAILEIEELLNRKPRQLSGGQRQRVAMGRAIVRKPKVFLFDEPLSNLDAKLRVQMRIEIRKLHKRLKATSIYVTHDQVEAMTLADRLIVMNNGIFEQIGIPFKIYDRPSTVFVAGFIGSPSMNFLSVRLDADAKNVIIPGGKNLLLTDDTLSRYGGREVRLGMRPEHLIVTQKESAMVHLKVDIVEALGADTLVHGHFGTDRTPLTVRLPGVMKVAENEILPLICDSNNLHFFDFKSGARLGSVQV
jgi:sn-glycerol 3-phosphate transport system ATP-binding protein